MDTKCESLNPDRGHYRPYHFIMSAKQNLLEQRDQPSVGSHVQRIQFGPVHLNVTNMDQSLEFWQGTLGMIERPSPVEGNVALGSVDRTLVILGPDARLARKRGYAGLYHFALHLSTESHFAHVIDHLRERSEPFSPVDHLLSKSIYLSDPDGIGLEFTLETTYRGSFLGTDTGGYPVLVDQKGRRHSAREALDVAGIKSRHPSPTPIWTQPGAVRVGHIHLTVPDLLSVRDHYMNEGFELSFHAHGIGMVELHTGGIFRHQLVLNNWQGPGAQRPPSDMAGLNHFTLIETDMSKGNPQAMHVDPAGNHYNHFKTNN